MNRIPSKFKHMAWMGFFMAGAIGFFKVYNHTSSSMFDILTIPPVIALLGGLVGILMAFAMLMGERLFVFLSACLSKSLP